MFKVYFESIKNFVMKYTSSILWTCFWNEFVFLFWVRSILEVYISRLSKLTNLHWKLEVYLYKVYFLNWCIFFQTQKYTWCGISKFFTFKLRSLLQVDFLYLCNVQTQKYTGSTFSKLMQTQKYIWSRFLK